MNLPSALALFLLSWPALAAPPLTLRELAAYAVEHSPAFDSAQRETLIAGLETKNSRAAFLPSLDFSAAHGWEQSRPRSATNANNPWTSNFALSLTENLYDNGQTITRYNSSKIREEEANIQLLQTRDRLFLQIANEFYQYSLATKTLEIQREQHKLLKKQYQMVEQGYQQGFKTRKDYLRFKTQVSRADIDLVNAQNELAQSEKELRKLIGAPLEGGETFTFALDESKPDKSPPARIAVERHREYQLVELANQNQRLQEAQTKRRLWPELNLTAGANYGSSNYLGSGQSISQNDRLGWNALLALRYNFFDWGTRAREVQIAGERAEIQENSGQTRLLELRQELDRLELNLSQLSQNFRLGEELLELEQRNLDLITSEYRQGKVAYLDYITSLKDFASARIGYYSSLFNLKKNLLNQKFHEGTLYETILGH